MAANAQQAATGITPTAVAAEEWTLPKETPRLVQWGRIARRNPIGVVALFIVVAFCFLGVFGPSLAPHDPSYIVPADRYQAPSWEHPFGTNKFGEDMFSRVLTGARISFLIGLMGVTIGYFSGAFLGIVSGYYQRWLDYVIQRSGEAWAAFPVLILYFAFITALGQGLKTIAIVIVISAIFGGSRVLRAASLITKHNDYVIASRSLGGGDWWILWKHIIPNVMPIIIVGASSVFAVSVLAEAALSFLGLGVDPGTPSWGIDMSDTHTPNLRDAPNHPYLVIFPGLAISLVVLGFNLLGDTLRDILDPRLRGSI
jgi:ABC-type dipeptide/oligopeptide/nickel transport system permease subunit